MDLYYPTDSGNRRAPAVILVTGFVDAGVRQMLGCLPKDMGSYISWAQLIAASGMVAITYANQEPATDVHTLLRYVRQHAAALNVDENRLALWACSGNAPNALSMLMEDERAYLKCVALCYPYMFDVSGRFLAQALTRNIPVTFANHSEAPHAFDLFHDDRISRTIIRQLLQFLQCHLAT
jgi:acetyl esterase/lipase